MSPLRTAAFLISAAAFAQVQTVQVQSSAVERKVQLTGEFRPFQQVAVHARVNGYVERVLVDRGAVVERGQLLAELSAPELTAQLAEVQSKAQAVAAQQAEAEAKLAAAQSTFERLKKAYETPGAIAGNELILSEKAVAAAQAAARSMASAKKAADASIAAVEEMRKFLRVTAPFAGTITERLVHPGALVGPGTQDGVMFMLEQQSRLRLVVAVPEANAGGIVRGARVMFTVPAYPGETFSGTVARIPRSIDPKTRTMPVELDVLNARGQLAPGMFPEVMWPVRRGRPSLLVPPAAVVTTTERTFVIRVNRGVAEWVNVRKGPPAGDLIEVFGDLRAGDTIVRRATDEIRDGSRIGS